MSQITTHILDTSKGSPAKGVKIVLYQQQNNNWIEIGKGVTNDDGRVTDLLAKETKKFKLFFVLLKNGNSGFGSIDSIIQLRLKFGMMTRMTIQEIRW